MKVVMEIELHGACTYYGLYTKFTYSEWWLTEAGCKCKVFNVPTPFQALVD